MESMMQYLLARLAERSTWLGLIALLSAFGIGIAPEQSDAVIGVGTAIAGAVGVFTKG